MTIAVIDVETTGLRPETASIVEFAMVIDENVYFSSLVRPRHPIELRAMAAHHIQEEDVEFAPEITGVLLQAASYLIDRKVDDITYYAAHNAAFDSSFLPGLAAKWICTYKCAQHIWPDAPGYSNQVLRYWLLGEARDEIKKHPAMEMPPHRALPDAFITYCLLGLMLEVRTPEELVTLSQTPVLQKTCGFGKHYGMPWSEVPPSFLTWLLSKGEEREIGDTGRREGFSEDIRHTANYYLGLKAQAEDGTKSLQK